MEQCFVDKLIVAELIKKLYMYLDPEWSLLPLYHVFSQINPLHTSTLFFFRCAKAYSSIYAYYRPPRGLVLQCFRIKILKTFLTSSLHYKLPVSTLITRGGVCLFVITNYESRLYAMFSILFQTSSCTSQSLTGSPFYLSVILLTLIAALWDARSVFWHRFW